MSDSYGNHVIVQTFKAEHLKADNQRGDRTVRDAAENGNHAAGSGNAGGGMKKSCHNKTGGSADGKGQDNFTAFIVSGQSDGCEKDFKEKSIRHTLSVKAGLDNINAGTVIVPGAADQR